MEAWNLSRNNTSWKGKFKTDLFQQVGNEASIPETEFQVKIGITMEAVLHINSLNTSFNG